MPKIFHSKAAPAGPFVGQFLLVHHPLTLPPPLPSTQARRSLSTQTFSSNSRSSNTKVVLGAAGLTALTAGYLAANDKNFADVSNDDIMAKLGDIEKRIAVMQVREGTAIQTATYCHTDCHTYCRTNCHTNCVNRPTRTATHTV